MNLGIITFSFRYAVAVVPLLGSRVFCVPSKTVILNLFLSQDPSLLLKINEDYLMWIPFIGIYYIWNLN